MSTTGWVLAVMAVSWAGVIVCAVGVVVTKYRAISAEDAKSVPGGLTADLGVCWAIWPDAPLAEAAPDDH